MADVSLPSGPVMTELEKKNPLAILKVSLDLVHPFLDTFAIAVLIVCITFLQFSVLHNLIMWRYLEIALCSFILLVVLF